MSAAFVIEVKDIQAGVIVRVADRRFRFFAGVEETYPLEGVEFVSPIDARRAAEQALAEAREKRFG